MNYNKIYNAIISNRISNPLRKSKSVYTEVHHIIPKCLGGDNSKSNLVRLTAREHFLAHVLLAKIYPHNIGLKLTVYLMCKHVAYDGIKKNRSRMYERLRSENANAVVSLEIRERMSRAKRGKKLSDHHKQKISENHGLRGKSLCARHRQKISKANEGKRHLDIAKRKVSIANSATWKIFHPYGTEFFYKGSLEKFCELNNISCNMMEMSDKNGGRICIANKRQRTQISKDTVGWGCKKFDN